MVDDFLVRAALAGIGLSLATGPLGAFILWRRMAFFGDATAHAAILGVALSFALSLPVFAGTLIAALAMALAVSALSARGHGADAALAVLSHSALALGLVAASFFSGLRTDLSAWLFGDILAVSARDLWLIWGGAGAILLLLVLRWQALLTATVSAELAKASGIDPKREALILTLALALAVAVAIKVVGALLVAAMLVIPAAAARGLARSPEAMALMAVIAGIAATLGGLGGALLLDSPAGPSIVAAAAILFALSLPFRPRS